MLNGTRCADGHTLLCGLGQTHLLSCAALCGQNETRLLLMKMLLRGRGNGARGQRQCRVPSDEQLMLLCCCVG